VTRSQQSAHIFQKLTVMALSTHTSLRRPRCDGVTERKTENVCYANREATLMGLSSFTSFTIDPRTSDFQICIAHNESDNRFLILRMSGC
jgi:hypothetical protein